MKRYNVIVTGLSPAAMAEVVVARKSGVQLKEDDAGQLCWASEVRAELAARDKRIAELESPWLDELVRRAVQYRQCKNAVERGGGWLKDVKAMEQARARLLDHAYNYNGEEPT